MGRRGLDATQIVAAAAEIADADGLDAVTIARVAAVLGVRPPSLYNHIGGHEQLIGAIALLALRETAETMRRAAVGRSGADAVMGVARAYRAYVLAHPGRWAAASAHFSREDPAHLAIGEEIQAVVIAVMRHWGLEGDDALHAVRVLRSASEGFVSLEAGGGFAANPDADVSHDRLVRMVIAGLDAWKV